MENVNQEIMSAEVFYKKSLERQLELVNVAIVKAMQSGNPIVKLPTQLYVKITDELIALGWEEEIEESEEYEEGFSWIYPVCLNRACSFPELIVIDKKFIPAEKFYEATLKNQRRDLRVASDEAIETGVSEVKLPYRAYPELIKEMEEKGWEHVFWHSDGSTEERSMFYPICGFEEEE